MCLTEAVYPKPPLFYFRYHWNTASTTVNFSLGCCGGISLVFSWRTNGTTCELASGALLGLPQLTSSMQRVFFRVFTGFPLTSIPNGTLFTTILLFFCPVVFLLIALGTWNWLEQVLCLPTPLGWLLLVWHCDLKQRFLCWKMADSVSAGGGLTTLSSCAQEARQSNNNGDRHRDDTRSTL